MIGLSLCKANIPLIHALGDTDVKVIDDTVPRFFVYYEDDDEFEIMTKEEYLRRFPGHDKRRIYYSVL